jgi:hypothetical protein
MFAVFAEHASVGAVLMFNTGPEYGEAVGSYRGDPLYHASLASAEYLALANGIDFEVIDHVTHDMRAGGRTVWLCKRPVRYWSKRVIVRRSRVGGAEAGREAFGSGKLFRDRFANFRPFGHPASVVDDLWKSGRIHAVLLQPLRHREQVGIADRIHLPHHQRPPQHFTLDEIVTRRPDSETLRCMASMAAPSSAHRYPRMWWASATCSVAHK